MKAEHQVKYYRNFEVTSTDSNRRKFSSIVFDFVWLSLLNCRVVGEARFFPKLGLQNV